MSTPVTPLQPGRDLHGRDGDAPEVAEPSNEEDQGASVVEAPRRAAPLSLIRGLRRVLELLPRSQQRRLRGLALLVGTNAVFEAVGVVLSLSLLKALFSDAGGDYSAIQWLSSLIPGVAAQTLVAWLAIAVAFLLAASNALAAIIAGESTRFASQSWRLIAQRAIEGFLRQPFQRSSQRATADLYKLSITDSAVVGQRVLVPWLHLTAKAAKIVAVLGALIALFPAVTLSLAAALLLLYALVYRVVRPTLQRNAIVLWEMRTSAARGVAEAFQGLREIKLFDLEHRMADDFRRRTDGLPERERSQTLFSVAPRFFLEGLMISVALLGTAAAVLAGYSMASVGPAIGVLGLAGARLLPLCSQSYQHLISIRAALTEIEPLLVDLAALPDSFAGAPAQRSAPIEPLRRDAAKATPHAAQLVLSDISYTYAGNAEPTLHGLNLELPRGSVTGIIGASGAGKSTLLDLMLGLAEIDSGSMTLEGRQFRPVDAAAWRRCIGYVPQQTFLVEGSIADNIAFGVPPEERDAVALEQAVRESAVERFLPTLAGGLEQRVGERGARLSGGQRQRVAIARALYRKPSLLVFDEATSALDMDTERAVLDAIGQLHGHTILLVTHRSTTLEICDTVYALRDGRLHRIAQDAKPG